LYKFNFSPSYNIPAGSKITITFPTGYDLLNSTPAPTFTHSGLIDFDANNQVSFFP